ncbi:MAG: hypothetical protein ACI8RD_004946 [Bacillariaceae sp.]|jgi:hypothetical protein
MSCRSQAKTMSNDDDYVSGFANSKKQRLRKSTISDCAVIILLCAFCTSSAHVRMSRNKLAVACSYYVVFSD